MADYAPLIRSTRLSAVLDGAGRGSPLVSGCGKLDGLRVERHPIYSELAHRGGIDALLLHGGYEMAGFIQFRSGQRARGADMWQEGVGHLLVVAVPVCSAGAFEFVADAA